MLNCPHYTNLNYKRTHCNIGIVCDTHAVEPDVEHLPHGGVNEDAQDGGDI